MNGKEKYFLKQIKTLSELIRIVAPIPKRDMRLQGNVAAVGWNSKLHSYILRYKSPSINRLEYWEITHLVLHELGHLKKKKAQTEEESEYKAEIYALKIIKKYYPKYYRATINLLERIAKTGKPMYYRQAFARVLYHEGEWTKI